MSAPDRAQGDAYTDLWNAEQLVATYGADLRWTPGWGWVVWDAATGCWHRDDLDSVTNYAKALVRGLYAKAAMLESADARTALAKHAARSEATGRITAMLQQAQSEPGVACYEAVFDSDPWLLNCANGIVNLRTGELRDHDRDTLLTKRVPVAYDPHARAPRWETFLRSTFAEQCELIAFVQRAVGYSLTASTREQVMFLLHGTGANGKSTFLNTLQIILGDYAQTAETSMLLAKSNDSGLTNDLAGLVGARLVVTAESDEGKRLGVALIKKLTGGDRMRVRFLRKEFFEFDPTFKIWFATNHKPRIPDSDYAIWRRLLLIPFTQTFVPADRAKPGDLLADPTLVEALAAEASGILAWAVAGARAWQAQGLRPPKEVLAATAAYQEEQDLLRTFLRERCRTTDAIHDRASAALLYNTYREWAKEVGEQPWSQRILSQKMKERGFDTVRGTGGTWYWDGIGIKD
jgi:putative DNA primase/helicase